MTNMMMMMMIWSACYHALASQILLWTLPQASTQAPSWLPARTLQMRSGGEPESPTVAGPARFITQENLVPLFVTHAPITKNPHAASGTRNRDLPIPEHLL